MSGPAPQDRAADSSVSAGVLRLLLENPIDLGYTSEAHDRQRPPWQRALAAVVIAAIVAVPLWAAKDLRSARVGVSASSALRDQVAEGLSSQDAIETTIAELNAEILQAQSSLLEDDGATNELATQLGIAAGTVPVTGPGIVVTLDDSSAASSAERIQDFDLQVLVNALWAAGAEAVAVDGQRLSPTTAVRNAGEAVLVNLTPLSPPYVVEAIGDPTDLQVRLARTLASGHLAVLRDTYGITVRIETADSLELGAAPSRGVEFAEILQGEDDADIP
ncbi:MAG: DUF881 domain-containing protein [Actinomycetes bacterium]|nr:DUF881 domain-containing protein [Actinomycetes bacterium]MDX5380572.1 DUF881 domain-containing protein [Actinomycetes bacterium]MDX5399471.1 DUF881 domain-containing protein [Actinomycetes bacterium]MDX5450314.1 DUF881 domain-containing protein [Actinomycetes bacterium]